MKYEDQDFDVTLCERVQQVPNRIEEEITAERLEKEEVKKTVEDVLHLGLAIIQQVTIARRGRCCEVNNLCMTGC